MPMRVNDGLSIRSVNDLVTCIVDGASIKSVNDFVTWIVYGTSIKSVNDIVYGNVHVVVFVVCLVNWIVCHANRLPHK